MLSSSWVCQKKVLLINQEQNINNCDLTYERFIRSSYWFQELFELQSFPCIILPVALIEKKNYFIAPRFAISHSEAVSTLLIFCYIMSLT